MAILQFNGATEINQSSWMWTKIGELMDNRIFNLHLPVDILSKTEADDLYVAQRDLPIIALNGRATQYPSFFAPTYGGTAGYYLKSNGPSSTPTWAQIPVVTDFYWANVRISATEVVNAEPQFQSLALAKGNLYIGTPNEHSYITPGSHYNLSGIQEIWLEGLNLVYRDNESSGIQLNDHYITLFSPANIYSLRYFDEDGGQEIWNIDKNGKFSGTLEWSHILNSPTIPQLSLNGVNRTLLNFYAPTAPGVAGQFLTSNGSNTAPSWTTLNLLTENDLPVITLNNNTTTAPTFFAPTTGGTSGQFLISNGNTNAPIWSTITIPSITLNNTTTLYPSFYAPTTAGTSGYYLKSNGSGKAPTWAAFPSIPVVTDYYWANIRISNQSKTNTTPAFQSLEIATDGHIYYGSPSDNSYISSSSAANDQTGLTITQNRDESSGIQFNGNYIVLFSPADSYCIRYFDEDGGQELWNINSSSVFSGYIDWSHINSKPTIPTITLNGSTTTSANFYAPTSVGTSGYYLKSNGSGAPTWTSLTIPSISLNGTTKTNPTFYAPTSGGTSGYYLKSNGNSAPTWAEFPTMPTITLNDTIRTSPAFYAPTSGGTSGYYLKSNGNAAPTWAEFPFTLNGNKNDNPSIYAPTTAGTSGYYLKSNGTGNAPTWASLTIPSISLNGTANTNPTFYAPTSVGTSGYYLKSNGSGAPTWTSLTIPSINLNGTIDTNPTFYAPTSGGTSGYYLKSNGIDNAPTWTSLTIPSINLNGTANTDPTFYAPTTAGTTGYYLQSNGTGNVPTWTEFPTMPTITLNNIIHTSPAFYAPTTAGTTGYYLQSNGTGNAPTWSIITVDWENIINKPASITMAENNIVARLNGADVASLNFYAPTTAGTAGYYLRSNGAGNAPTWVSFGTVSSLFCYQATNASTQSNTIAFDFNNNLRLRATSEGLVMSIDKIQTSATNMMEPYIQWYVEGSIDGGPSERDRCSVCKIGLANINYINNNLKSYSLFMSFMDVLASTTNAGHIYRGSELNGIEWQIKQGSAYNNWGFDTIILKPTSGIKFSIGASDSPLEQIYSKAFTNTTSAADYAEKRIGIENLQPGTVVRENNLGILIPTIERLMPGAEVVSDTYGTILNATATLNNTPVAVAGLVLAIPYQAKENYKPGMAVCSAPNGTIDIMTREEIQQYPDCIVGIVSSIPDYETWGENNISVNNRIWIKVR